MRTTAPAAVLLCLAVTSGCSWLGRGSNEQPPEKLIADQPCPTECCCKTKRGYYAYFRCQERAPCEQEGGTCERPDYARCAAEGAQTPGADGEARAEGR